MKKLIPAYVLSFLVSFMLFLYEPLLMYSTNINDFWFDLKTIFSPLIILALACFLLICTIFSIIYYLNNRFYKGKRFYVFLLLISYSIFFALYIEGNYLSMMLPSLDGSLTWDGQVMEKIVSSIIWILIITIMVVFGRKKTYEKVINVSKFVSLGIMVMLLASLLTVTLSSGAFLITKNPLILTKDNLVNASSEKNFYILVLDTIDSTNFEKIVKNSNYQDTFNDFTYYPDTVGAYLYTRDSIPFILSNKWNLNEDDFREYSTKALDEALLFKKLEEQEYSINLYDTEIFWDSENRNILDNMIPFEGKIGEKSFYKQILKYVLFKYLPYPIKSYSRVNTLDFNVCKSEASSNYFKWNNQDMYDTLNEEFKIDDTKYFKFIHLEGAHPPYNSDKELNIISNGTHEQKEEATLKLVNRFINKLKETNTYDNSIIIIMADHGIHDEDVLGRQNPILYIKGIGEHHEMYTSDLPISYAYLNSAYEDLLNDKKSNELFQNIDLNVPRKFLYYRYLDENHMVEYEVLGKAWETDKLRKTGKEYNLE